MYVIQNNYKSICFKIYTSIFHFFFCIIMTIKQCIKNCCSHGFFLLQRVSFFFPHGFWNLHPLSICSPCFFLFESKPKQDFGSTFPFRSSSCVSIPEKLENKNKFNHEFDCYFLPFREKNQQGLIKFLSLSGNE